jgi:hypothetical protein
MSLSGTVRLGCLAPEPSPVEVVWVSWLDWQRHSHRGSYRRRFFEVDQGTHTRDIPDSLVA